MNKINSDIINTNNANVNETKLNSSFGSKNCKINATIFNTAPTIKTIR